MSPLRQRMLEDMQIRHLASRTQQTYIEQVARFARHHPLVLMYVASGSAMISATLHVPKP